jgi:hypothetical protein
MSHLAFHSPDETIYLSGREVHHISALAKDALVDELSHPAYRRLCAELRLPSPHSQFFASEIFSLMSDGETHRVQGQDIYLFNLALTVLVQHRPAARLQCWLYDNAIEHGWVAGPDRPAMAAQIEAALDAGVARRAMADRHTAPMIIGDRPLPTGNRNGWEDVIAFLNNGTGDVFTSISVGNAFPDRDAAMTAGTWRPTVANTEEPWDELDELWDQLGPGEQWDLSARAVRGNPALQWRPADVHTFGPVTVHRERGLVPVPAAENLPTN